MPHQRRTSQLAQGRSGGASQSEQQRAPDWNPLAKLSTHHSGGWKKDLDCYMGAYFWLNYRHEPSPNHEKGTPLPQVSKVPPRVRGVPETPPGVAEENLESPALHGAPPGNVVVPSLGGRIPARWFRSPSRTTKADSRPFGCCMKRPEKAGWPLR